MYAELYKLQVTDVALENSATVPDKQLVVTEENAAVSEPNKVPPVKEDVLPQNGVVPESEQQVPPNK